MHELSRIKQQATTCPPSYLAVANSWIGSRKIWAASRMALAKPFVKVSAP
jgi:hypothetical protein